MHQKNLTKRPRFNESYHCNIGAVIQGKTKTYDKNKSLLFCLRTRVFVRTIVFFLLTKIFTTCSGPEVVVDGRGFESVACPMRKIIMHYLFNTTLTKNQNFEHLRLPN